MTHAGPQMHLVAQHDPRLLAALESLARQQRLVFFAGLPGTGKSLLVHQLAHLAHAAGRVVHLLQWDVARPVFEASPAGQRYPVQDGVTHAVIRMAAGLWIRQALLRWHQRYPARQHILIGETPFVGYRFIDLARPQDDATETLLTAAACCFVVPVPSPTIRQLIATHRQQRSHLPHHPQERQDAPPQVLHDLWQQLVAVAPQLGIEAPAVTGETPYNPVLYRRVYASLLRYRQVQVIPLTTALPTTTWSVHAFAMPRRDVIPDLNETQRLIAAVEAQYPDVTLLQRVLAQWYNL